MLVGQIALRVFDRWSNRKSDAVDTDEKRTQAELNREKTLSEQFARQDATIANLEKRLDAQAALIEKQQGQIGMLQQENAALRRTNEQLVRIVQAYQEYQSEVDARDPEVQAHGLAALPKPRLPEVN